MNPVAIQKIQLHHTLSKIPENRLVEAKTYLNTLVQKKDAKQSDRGSLKGIWKNKGFEKIDDQLEEDIKKLGKKRVRLYCPGNFDGLSFRHSRSYTAFYQKQKHGEDRKSAS